MQQNNNDAKGAVEPSIYGSAAASHNKDAALGSPTVAALRKPLTLHRLREMANAGEKIAMLTCYDATFAAAMDVAGVDVLLIGDSLGMVVQGQRSTLGVSMLDMEYHTRAVAKGAGSAWVVGDMPFGSYQESPEQAFANAARLMQAGAQMVKLEGGGWTVETVRFLTQRGVPVCAHLGLTPQSVHALGGYRIQGKDAAAQEAMLHEAKALAEAGAAMLVVELIPSGLGARITEALAAYGCMVIGIGAGPQCHGQVLVMHDMLGVTGGKLPRFVRNFMQGSSSVEEAFSRYVQAVKAGAFPDTSLHGY